MRRNRILVGDALEQLGKLPDGAADTVITSPPYFQLRDYGTAGQLGLEETPEEWVENLLGVARQLARVLAGHGSWWLNLGDSYSRGGRSGVPAKSLVLTPERLLLALAADGWLVRNKVVWSKTNPLPSSVHDRLNCTWEPLYLLVRQPRYYFDLDAIRIPRSTPPSPPRNRPPRRSQRPEWVGPLAGDQHGLDVLKAEGRSGHPLGKNPGDVWRLPTAGYREAHMAVFPEELAERALLATCPESVCRVCGRPWQRQPARHLGTLALTGQLRPRCRCRAPSSPGLVLDPFVGSGTTAVVAERLQRDWLGIELNPAFARLARQRLLRDRASVRESERRAA